MTSPSAPASAPAPRPTHRSPSGQIERRTIWLSAALLFGALIAGITLVAVFAHPGNAHDPSKPNADGTFDRPRIITAPNSGHEPTNPGDRGGWEQLALLGLIVVAVGGMGFVAVRSGGAKARANREAWKAAAATGRDGAIDPGP